MMAELAISLGKIVGSVLLLAAVLAGVGFLARRLRLQPEIARKIIHVSLGLYCLTFPWVFDQAWEVAAVCLLAGAVFVIARSRPTLGEGLHGVKRFSYGELLFAVSVALLFWLKDGHYSLEIRGIQAEPQLILYVLPILLLTLSDAASALVGVNYGRMQFPVEDGVKSVEGVLTFILTAWIAALIALLLFTDLGRGDVIVLALIAALFGSLFEAASWRGLDNLFIPMGLYFILANLLPRGTTELLITTLGFAIVTGLLATVGVRLNISRHVVASGLSLLFCIAIFAGPMAVLTPGAAFAAYYAIWRQGERRDAPHDALNMIITALTVALAVFVISALLRVDTIYTFNLAFACLATGILVRFGRLRPTPLAGGVALICSVGLVRALAVPVWRPETFVFIAFAIVLVVGSVGLFSLMRQRSPGRPWIKLGALSLLIGLAGLPLSPGGGSALGLSG
ncbi:diacylglycerol/polyprenol kinase family protein [Brevundimonas sp.]|uniref:diacylglycerol/polyprenol kinase family protein n=1 Tax=Brevundimonas sp. TaxID=1871086 RepID=UPI003D1501CE